MDNKHVIKETTVKVEKIPLVLVPSYLDSISIQTTTKLKTSFINILNCCDLKTVFNSKTRLGNNSHFKDQIFKVKFLLPVPFINFSIDSAMSPVMVNV